MIGGSSLARHSGLTRTRRAYQFKLVGRWRQAAPDREFIEPDARRPSAMRCAGDPTINKEVDLGTGREGRPPLKTLAASMIARLFLRPRGRAPHRENGTG
jgi:hypothetical protein